MLSLQLKQALPRATRCKHNTERIRDDSQRWSSPTSTCRDTVMPASWKMVRSLFIVEPMQWVRRGGGARTVSLYSCTMQVY